MRVLWYTFVIVLLMQCKSKEIADLVIHNAVLYAVDTTYQNKTAIAIKNGKILAIENETTIENYINESTNIVDAKGSFVMPGFIEGHGHYIGLGNSKINLNFLLSKSWEEIVSMVKQKTLVTNEGDWIVGRGWHQEKWDSIPTKNIYKYPYHTALTDVSQNNPVILYHASGHSLFANKKAMEIAGVGKETPNPVGGEIVRDKNGDAIGVFEENAMEIIQKAYDHFLNTLSQSKIDSLWLLSVQLAENECLSKGITSFQDAGSKYEDLDRFERLANEKKLNVRLWVMARHPYNELKDVVQKYKKIGVGDNFYTCNAIKSEVDGALGAFGAWLLQPYSDKPGFVGQNTTDIYDVKNIADIAFQNQMQFCVHAIGDRANRVVLDIYEGVLSKDNESSDRRWRIEHAQHIAPEDIPRFASHNIIASMQGIHCTSDAPFVVKRLGVDRARLGAYAWRSLLDAGVKIANGTDAPVEDVDPLRNLYASVTRKRIDNGMVFFSEQSMTRQEALYSYTLGNAYAAFEDNIKGSLRIGKLADIIIVDRNLLTCTDEELLNATIQYTIVDGNIKFKK